MFQQQFRNDREQWEKQVERFQRSFDNDRSEFEREKQQIAKQREENEKQKLEIQKAKEYYQSEVKRLKELQRQTHHHEMHSSTTSLSGNKNNSSNVEPMSRSYTNLQTPGVDTSDSKHSPTFAEGDYPRTYPSHKRDSSSSNPQQLPIHMQYSIVNQQAATQQVSIWKNVILSTLSDLGTSFASSKLGSYLIMDSLWFYSVIVLLYVIGHKNFIVFYSYCNCNILQNIGICKKMRFWLIINQSQKFVG